MEGDFSLSQSFGGLRIANPDDASINTSGEPLASSVVSPAERNASNADNSLSHSANLDDQTVGVPNLSRQNKLPVPSTSQDSHRHHHPLTQPSPSVSLNSGRETGDSSRPKSTYFVSPTPNGPSSTTAPQPGSYRFHTESPTPASKFSSKIDSRGGSAALQAGVLVRDDSYMDRDYTKPNQNYVSGGAPLPPRQSSRRVHNNASPHVGSPYGVENTPLHSSEEWHERGAAVGVRQEIDSSGNQIARYVKKGVRDFSFGRTLGEGSYSTVVAATDRQTLKEYAIKVLDKRHIIKEKKVKYVNIEKDTLNRLTEHPGVVRLYYTFQDERSLYFVLDLASGGELLGVLKRMGTFDEECTRFYGAQILDTVGYMHRRGVIHRDLKPENVLLDSQMHVKITDFGTAKMLTLSSQADANASGVPSMDSSDEDRASSFVGTAEYVSPELLTNKSACKASDLWAFGCIIYQLLVGRPPFKAGNEYQTFQKIVGLEYEFPKGFPPHAHDLVERLLVHDPARRLQMEHIKNHEFFNGTTWGRDLWKQKPPRLKPYVPPPAEPINLNGTNDDANTNMKQGVNFPSNVAQNRQYPHLVTELPPPSQLDIEWSPVLTTNERILKLGNLLVSTSSAPRSQNKNGNGDGEAPKKLSRFFGGATNKKRQRLVLVSSAGRVIIVPAGGEDKRPKIDISLLHKDTQYRSTMDSKGYSSWAIHTRDKNYVFEEAKHISGDVGSSAVTTQEWLDTLDRAKEMATLHSTPTSHLADDNFRDLSSSVSSHANTLNQPDELSTNQYHQGSGRAALVKHQPHGITDSDSVKAKKRFSRHSKNGLSAVF